MPVFNESKYLDRSINSVIKQNMVNKELICVNDGSTDDSKIIIEKYAEKHDFIKVINQNHNGVSHARNVGLKESNGTYISFLDADDEFLNTIALQSMFDVAIENNANVVSSNIKRKDENGQILIDSNYLRNYYNYFPINTIINSEDYGIPWAFYKNIYKKSFLEENNITFPSLNKGSDMVFLTNVLKSVETIPVINKNLYAYHYLTKGFSEYNINRYDEKYDYITHFKMIFDIFLNQNDNIPFENYKRVLLDYLLYGQNIYDNELMDIFSKVFFDIDNYFKPDENEYPYIQGFFMEKSSINNKQLSSFADLKYDLFKQAIEGNTISFEDLNKYQKFSDDNDNLFTDSFEGLKKMDSILEDDLINLFQKIDEVNQKNDILTESNEKILSSKSWRITDSLRKIKHLIK